MPNNFKYDLAKLAKGLSGPMVQMLRDISRHGDAFYSAPRRPKHGGATGTTQSLFRRGLLVSLNQLSNLGALVLLKLDPPGARFYVQAIPRQQGDSKAWRVIDFKTGLPVFHKEWDTPAIFETWESAHDCAENLNSNPE